jgi:hypothetical protein
MVSEGISSFGKLQKFLRELPRSSDPGQRILNTLWNSYKMLLDYLQRHFFQEDCSINIQRENFLLNTVQKLKLKIKFKSK